MLLEVTKHEMITIIQGLCKPPLYECADLINDEKLEQVGHDDFKFRYDYLYNLSESALKILFKKYRTPQSNYNR